MKTLLTLACALAAIATAHAQHIEVRPGRRVKRCAAPRQMSPAPRWSRCCSLLPASPVREVLR